MARTPARAGGLVPGVPGGQAGEVVPELAEERPVVVGGLPVEEPGVVGLADEAVLLDPGQGRVRLGALAEEGIPLFADEAAGLLDVFPIDRVHLGELDLGLALPPQLGFEEGGGRERPAGPGLALHDGRQMEELGELEPGRSDGSKPVRSAARNVGSALSGVSSA